MQKINELNKKNRVSKKYQEKFVSRKASI